MANVEFESRIDDESRRQRLFRGDLFVYDAREASRELCALAREMLEEAFAPHHPETAQHHISVEEYAGILAELKPRFIHHPECKRLLAAVLVSLGCDPAKTFFDVPRLRTSTSDGYLTTGIAYAFHPHRDTWYSAPHCQINWWMPVYEIEADNGMAFYPRYFDEAVKNSSHTYDYYRWNRESRANAANQIGKDTRVQPKAQETMDLSQDLRLVTDVGGMIGFSGAQMHASIPNTTGRTRISIDFRVVNEDDVQSIAGAPNVDSECTGTALRDFLRCTDLARLEPELVRPYDVEEPPEDAITVYEPEKLSQ
jgi:hypothetical protein